MKPALRQFVNRYDDPVDEEDEALDEEEFERFCSLTPEQQQREIDVSFRRLVEYTSTLSPKQDYNRSRRMRLRHILTYRNLIRQGHEFLQKYLRERQTSLVELRTKYYGKTPVGHA